MGRPPLTFSGCSDDSRRTIRRYDLGAARCPSRDATGQPLGQAVAQVARCRIGALRFRANGLLTVAGKSMTIVGAMAVGFAVAIIVAVTLHAVFP